MTTPHTDHPMRHFDRTCPGCAENEMTYQLPEPEYLGWDYERLLVKPIRGYTADQMQAAYQAGRDAMKAECVKVCEDIANKYNCMEEADARIAGQWCRDAIKELK